MTNNQAMSNNPVTWLFRNTIVTALFCGLMCACVFQCSKPLLLKPSQESVDTFQQEHPDLPALDKKCISAGRFEIGILQSTLLFLMGKPDAVATVKREWAVQEHWIYKRGGRKTFIIEEQHVVGILTEQ
jgi:hypothetical protein